MQERDAWGQALVEFALVVPVMLVLMLLAVDFGRLFFTYVAVNNAAREGTYYAARHASDAHYDQIVFEAAVARAAINEANAQGQGGEGPITVSAPTCFDPATRTAMACDTAAGFATGSGNHVSVEVSQPFTFLTPIVGEIFGGQLTLSASATGPVLNPAVTNIIAGIRAHAHPHADAHTHADTHADTHTHPDPDADARTHHPWLPRAHPTPTPTPRRHPRPHPRPRPNRPARCRTTTTPTGTMSAACTRSRCGRPPASRARW